MSMNGKEIVSLVTLISNEKQVDKELIFKSLEDSLSVSLKKDFGKFNIKALIDRTNGSIKAFKLQEIVADVDYEDENQIKLSEARKINSKAVIGETLETELEVKTLSRVNAQVFKQVIKQNFKIAERKTSEEHYSSLIGSLFTATVKKVLKDTAILVLNDETEGKMPLSEANGYFLKPGSKVRVVLEGIETGKNQSLIFSRNSEKYVRAVVTQEIPAIGDEHIEILKVARIPGKRTKIVVKGLIAHVDPLRECIGPKGIRVKEVIAALNGEQVDFVNYDKDFGQYINNIMNPIEVVKVVLDESFNKSYFAIKDSDYNKYEKSISIYEQLASKILNSEVVIKSASNFEEEIAEKDGKLISDLMDKLNVDEELAEVLVSEGFDSIEAIAYSPESELLSIDGFDEELIKELKEMAFKVINTYSLNDLSKLKNITIQIIDELSNKGIKNREDLADLSTDELMDLVAIDTNHAKKLILEAREVWN